MSNDSRIAKVIAYHEATKHHPHRFARSLGYLDWATQPDPFRRYAGAETVQLALGPLEDEPGYEAIYTLGGIVPRSVNHQTISALFECSLALSAWKTYHGSSWALRVNPSSGNLHPTEGYLICGPDGGIGDSAGVYHYAPRDHLLERRHEISADTWGAIIGRWGEDAFLVGLTSIHWREAWKYGERAFRYCQHDAGHALACLRLSAARLGWRLSVIHTLGEDEIGRLLGVDRAADFLDAEKETAELIAAVWPDDGRTVGEDIPAELIGRAAAGAWFGRANRLSTDHVDWPIIDEVSAATVKQRTQVAVECAASAHTGGMSRSKPASVGTGGTDPAGSRGATAREIFLRRRSATDFDGVTTLKRDAFYHMLRRIRPSDSPPWDAIGWPPKIHLLMFVHRVDGLVPGLYAFLRDPSTLEKLRGAMRRDWLWRQAEGAETAGLGLYLLHEVDCRRAAAQLSLGQAIAGDSAFSFGMIAEFEDSLMQNGPWFYRRLFWEAGMVGQVLYLEADAEALRSGTAMRATGIGAYFDDEVHRVFGLEDRRFQSMYHFTIGGAVDDDRLTTRPAYA